MLEVEHYSLNRVVISSHLKVILLLRFYGRHLGFPVEGDVGFFGDGTIEKPVPENGGG